jgi:hypothetical protein
MNTELIIGREYLVCYKTDKLAKYPTIGYYIYEGVYRTNEHALSFVPQHEPDPKQKILIYKDEIMEIKPIAPLLNRQSDKDYLGSIPNTPKVGDKWFIKLPGHILLRKARITDITGKVVGLIYTEGPAAPCRYKLGDVEFVELVPAASGVDTAISELEQALYDKRGKLNKKVQNELF